MVVLDAEVQRRFCAVVSNRCCGSFSTISGTWDTPLPYPDALRVLPPPIRNAIFNGILGNDVVALA